MPELTLSDDTRLHYTDTGGEGRPVVLIHGWPLSGASWTAASEALRGAGHRVITYDRRGFGASWQPAEGYDYDTLASDLNELVLALDLTDAVLVGFSMGGGEVARYCGTYGTGRLAGIVLAAAITPALGQTADNPDGAMPQEAFDELAQQCATDRAGFLDGFVHTFFSSAEDGLKVGEEVVQQHLALAAQGSDVALPACIKIWSTDLRDDLRRVDVPTLVLHGDGDQNVPFAASAARVSEFVPHAELIVFPDGPHGINVSDAERFNGALLDFVASLPPRG